MYPVKYTHLISLPSKTTKSSVNQFKNKRKIEEEMTTVKL